MKVLITGCAGFIGFSFCNFLLNKKKFKVYGLDIINNYYSKSFKTKKIGILKSIEKILYLEK